MQDRPEKPRADFPLFPHRNGQWAKKIRGKFVYFGPWNDPKGAEKRYKATLSDSLGEATRQFLEFQEEREEIGEISYQHRMDLTRALDKLKEVVGEDKKVAQITAKDWGRWRRALNSTNEVVTQRNVIIRIQAFLNWCVSQKIIDEKPNTHYLKKPSRKDLRLARASQGERMFAPDEIKKLLLHSGQDMKAMILLGINAGLGPSDLGFMETKHLRNGWLDYPRNKTGVRRRVPLWAETLAALKAVIREDDDLVFRTSQGNPWTVKAKSGTGHPISQKFTKKCQDVGVYVEGRGFYSLRRTCQTIGEESSDLVAIKYIMGHAEDPDDMSSIYRQRMTDGRLKRVVNHIHDWLYGVEGATFDYPNDAAPITSSAEI